MSSETKKIQALTVGSLRGGFHNITLWNGMGGKNFSVEQAEIIRLRDRLNHLYPVDAEASAIMIAPRQYPTKYGGVVMDAGFKKPQIDADERRCGASGL